MKVLEEKRNLIARYYDYLAIIIFYFPLHLFMGFECWDDILYTNYFQEYHYNLWEFMLRQYQCWTSRIFIEAANILFGWFPPFIWKVADTLMIVLLYHSLGGIVKLWTKDSSIDKDNKIYFLLLFLSFPYALMGTAGWLTTTINWTWMLALLVYCLKNLLYSIKTQENVRKKNFLKNVIYCIAFLYATNFDVASLLVLCLLLVMGVACWKTSSYRFCLEYWEGVAITVFNFVLFLLCPGNRVRMERDAAFHDTEEMLSLSLGGKLRMGINSTWYHFVSIPNVILFMMCVVLLIAVFWQRRKIFDRVIACIPLGAVIVWTGYVFLAYTVQNGVLTYIYPDAEFHVCSKTEQYWAIASAIIVVGSVVYLLKQTIADMGVFIFLTVTLLVWGLMPEVVLGFTTTISASILRVVSFAYLAFMIICAVVAAHSKILKFHWLRKGVLLAAGVGAVMNWVQIVRHIIVYG